MEKKFNQTIHTNDAKSPINAMCRLWYGTGKVGQEEHVFCINKKGYVCCNVGGSPELLPHYTDTDPKSENYGKLQFIDNKII